MATKRSSLTSTLSKVSLTAIMLWGAAALWPAGELRAVEMSGNTTRITRTSPNQGGSGATPMSSNGYKARGTIGEVSQGLATSTTKKIGDGLMKIYFYPGTITDIQPTQGTNAGEIALTWTAPDDGHKANPLRTVSKYAVRYSTHPDAITDQNYFENTASLYVMKDPGVPGTPGSTESLTITGLVPGTSYYIAIEARDADKNQGYLSNSTYTWAQRTVLSVLIENLDGNPDFYGFGAVKMSSAVVSTATIRVSNIGTTNASWSLRAATVTANSPWQLTRGAMATDVFRLSAGFDEVQPSTNAFSASDGQEDRLINVDALASGTTFTIDGSSTGVNVPVAQSRQIWFLMETPPATSTTEEQHIEVTVTANTP